MVEKVPITQERLKEVLEYRDGHFFWRVSRGRCKAGSRAGNKHIRGYWEIAIDNISYLAHRLVWFWFHKEWPKQVLDHIDRNPLNNRIENLRDISQSENVINADLRTNNTSGHTNIHWNKQQQRWNVVVTRNRKAKYHGSFSSLEDAVAYKENL